MKFSNLLLASWMLSLIVLSTNLATSAPADFAPFEPMLGNWVGDTEITMTDKQGKKNSTSYQKQSECKLSEDGKSFLMTDIEIHPVTKKESKMISVITSTPRPTIFNAEVTEADGRVRHFLIRAGDKVLEYKLLNSPKDVKFVSKVEFLPDGTLREKGMRSAKKPVPFKLEWSVVYSPKAAN